MSRDTDKTDKDNKKLRKILIATRNPGKFKEIKSFLEDLPIKIISLNDLKIKDSVLEDGKTYKENSGKKAIFYAKLSGLPTIADDGGIEIDALGGEPGVRSRRFFANREKEATDEVIIEKMVKLVNKLPQNKRGARFKTVVTFALPDGKSFSAVGIVRGILKEPHLKLLHGYPYRSFFYIPKLKKYYHENQLSEKEMKVYNHRWKAISKLKPIIKQELGIMN